LQVSLPELHYSEVVHSDEGIWTWASICVLCVHPSCCTQEHAKINVFRLNVPRSNRGHMCCLQLVLFWQMLMLCWDSALALSMFATCFASCRQLTHMTVYLQSCYPTLWSCWWDVSFMYG